MTRGDDSQLPSSDDDVALDRLLATARWEEPSAEALERSRTQWRTLRAHAFSGPVHGARRARLIFRLAVGAAIAASVCVVYFIGVPRRAKPAQPTGTHVIFGSNHSDGLVREPTPFERLLGTPTRWSRRGPARPNPPPAPPAPPPPPEPAAPVVDSEQGRLRSLLISTDPHQLEQFLECVVDASTREAALDALAQMPQPPIEALARQLNNGRVDRRFAAAVALGRVCQPEVIGRLRWMVETNVNRREALAALMQCHEPEAVRYLAAARSDRAIDSQARSVEVQLRQIF